MGEKMNWSEKDGRLIVRIPENITSANADRFLREIRETLNNRVHDALEIDLSSVDYVSSAGLRIFLSLNKSEKAMKLTGVRSSVYEILEVTGFDRILTVSRVMRKISLEHAELIGDGFFSHVYRLDEENIIKVFIRNTSEEDIQRELDLDKYALISGLPTAISYDIVETDDGKKGVIYEMMNCGSFRDVYRDQPDQREHLLDVYTAMILELHAVKDTEKKLPDARARVLGYLEQLDGILTPAQTDTLRKLLLTIPESDQMLHGDCHVKNIMMHNGEPLLIDLDTLSRGDPVIELGNLFYSYCAFEEIWPGNSLEFMGLDAGIVRDIFDGLLKRYFREVREEDREENLARIRAVGYLRFLAYLEEFRGEDREAIRLTKERLLRCASACTDLRLAL